MSPGQIAAYLIGCAVVIVGAYAATYYLAAGSKKLQKGRMIRVLDHFSVSKDKSLLIVGVLGKIYLVALSLNSAVLLDTLDPEEVGEFLEKNPQQQNPAVKNVSGALSFLGKKLSGEKSSPPKPKKRPGDSLGQDVDVPFDEYMSKDDLDLVYALMNNRKLRSRGKNSSPGEDFFE